MSDTDSSALQPLEKNVRLSERVYASLMNAIVRCELPPGTPIGDRELAARLSVSRTPVREALQRLQTMGLVAPLDGSGWRVEPVDARQMHEMFELRGMFETLGLEALSRDPVPELVEELAHFFDEFPDQVEHKDYERYFAVDHAFHKRLVDLSGNRQVERFYHMIECHIDRGRHYLSTGWRGRVDDNLREHRAVSRAIGAHDFPAAIAALRAHLAKGEELMTVFIELSSFDAPS